MTEMLTVPTWQLSHGQAAWVIAHGRNPPRRVLDQLRYLRQLGVPFTEAERQPGRGNRVFYRYEEVVEMAVAIFAIRHGMRPGEAADFLTQNREDCRKLFRGALEQLPAAALDASWIKSQGREIPIMANELFLRLHDRYSERPGAYETIMVGEGAGADSEQSDSVTGIETLLGLAERYPGGESRILVPLTRIALEVAGLAREVPEIRPGRS